MTPTRHRATAMDLLVCPLSRGPLRSGCGGRYLVSDTAGLAWPVRDGIPVLLPAEAVDLAEVRRMEQEQANIEGRLLRQPPGGLTAIDAAHWRSYFTARYEVVEYNLVLSIGQESTELQRLLAGRDISDWLVLTAWNPASRQLAAADNQARDQALRRELVAAGYDICLVRCGCDDCCVEEGLMVFAIDRARSLRLGQAWGQNAVVVPDDDGVPALLDCRPAT